MLYRAVLLAAVFRGVFGGGAVAARQLMFRRAIHQGTEEDGGGAGYVCGKDVTPDLIQRCVYTDCFNNAGANVLHRGLSRRRLGGYTGPFPNAPDCTVNPTAPNADWGAVPANAAACPAGDSLASEPILGATVGTNVCSYSSPIPSGNGQTCQCKTVRCRVITKEDTQVARDGSNQAADQKACNFIVRIEDTHAVPGVPKWIMWVIFGLSFLVAGMTSAFFICLYGSNAHKPHGEEAAPGDNE